MAGGGGSTGGIGAQSPAVNPPSPVGQISNQIGNVAGSAFGGAQQPMLQTGQFGSQPIPMGNNPAYNGQPQGPMGGMAPDYATSFPTPRGFGQAPQQGPFMGGVSAPNSPGQAPFDPSMMGGDGFTPGFGQQQQTQGLSQQMDAYMQTSPAMKQMQDLQKQIQSGQLTPEAGQAQGEALNAQLRDYQQKAPMMPQIQAMQQAQAQAQGGMGQQPAGIAGLTALLQGMPNQTAQPRPAPAMAPNPGRPAPVATKPAPVATKPPPVAAKPVAAKPSMVPPKTPPAVASAIQKLAAKKPIGKR